jgi:U6 snRNA-associated Sm-like protein LSm4
VPTGSTTQTGDTFTKIPEVYIRGNTIKYLRIPEEVIDKVQEDANLFAAGGGGERGRGRGRGGYDRGGRGGGAFHCLCFFVFFSPRVRLPRV